jgi:hypothetical protein
MWYKLKRIMMRPNGVEKQVRPSGWGWWQPWANTIAYYPFRSDILDHSWNNNDFTWWVYTFSNNTIAITSDITWPIVTPESTTWDRTINIWVSRNNVGVYIFRMTNSWSEWHLVAVDGENWNRPWVSFKTSRWYRNRPSASALPTMWDIILVTWTKTGTTMSLYINWVLGSTTTLNTATWRSSYEVVGQELTSWTYWEAIIENKIRTAQEISDYYDLTKSNYWL